jgi:hypothetical protein
MSEMTTYYLKGRFEGHFKTKQRSFLKTDEPIPKGDEHQVKIYRGIVSQTEELKAEEFDVLNGFYNFQEIANIQVNKSNHWPLSNDRIFTLKNAKLVNVKFSNVQQIGDQTNGEISADISAKVTDGDYLEQSVNWKDKPIESEPIHNPNFIENENTGNTIGNGNDNNLSSRRGCFSWSFDLKWLRWLLYLLAILLLLYILGRCTQFGEKIYCKLDDWSIQDERKELKEKLDSLRFKIENTSFHVESCGGGGNPDGSNQPWSKVISLGNRSGTVYFSFNANLIPDRLEVIYDGKTIAESSQFVFEPREDNNDDFSYLKEFGGFTQYFTLLTYNYIYKDSKPTEILVRVIPNKMYETTEWDLDISCPQ